MSQISQAYISKLTRGKPISNDDDKSLLEYYYPMSDCVVALKQINYVYDLYSTDVLRQTIRGLPSKFHNRWAEHCFKIKRHKERSLTNLELWLQERALASKEVYLPPLNMKQRKEKIMLVMKNGLVRPHSVSSHTLCVKKITSFVNGKAKKP